MFIILLTFTYDKLKKNISSDECEYLKMENPSHNFEKRNHRIMTDSHV